jgi:hypothetical protein
VNTDGAWSKSDRVFGANVSVGVTGGESTRTGENMKTWYFAKCVKCAEVQNFFVNNPSTTAHYLSDKDVEIQAWFSKHYGCELTMGWRDDHLDKLWDEGYENRDLKY